MVTDSKTEKEDIKGLPMFDSTNVVNWSKRLKMWLMRRKKKSPGFGQETRTSSTGCHSSCLSGVQAGPGSVVGKKGHVCQFYLRGSAERT